MPLFKFKCRCGFTVEVIAHSRESLGKEKFLCSECLKKEYELKEKEEK